MKRKPKGRRRARLLEVLRALADGTRLDVYLRIAAGKGPVCVCELTGRFPVSQPTISHHLKVLREAGLVTVTRRGTWSWFEAVPGGLAPLRDMAAGGIPRGKVRRAAKGGCR